MPQELLSAALEESKQAGPVVRAAALLRAARVINVFDVAEAEKVLGEGIALVETLDEPDRGAMLGQAVWLAATVSPDRAVRLAPSLPANDATAGDPMSMALYNMISHGHVAVATEYVSALPPIGDYPFDAAFSIMGCAPDDEVRIRILRAALRAIRQMTAGQVADVLQQSSVLRELSRSLRLLPLDEATDVIRDLVRAVLAEPDRRMSGSYDDVRFSSTREFRLFEILGPLRRMDPALADSLIAVYPQLAAAAARYPEGPDSIHAAALERATQESVTASAAEPVKRPDLMQVGGRLVAVPELLRTDFKEAFDVALRLHARDTDEDQFNDAPQELWPSAYEFRHILYNAGRIEGRSAARHLDRVPDPVLRLFAQIELAAALAGLPQLGGRSISPGPYGFRKSMAMREQTREGSDAPAPPFAPSQDRFEVGKPNLPPSYDVHISPTRRAPEDGPCGGSAPDYWVIEAALLKPVLATLYEMSERRIEVSVSIEGARYDLRLVLPRGETRETLFRLMREGLEKHFHIARASRSMEVEVLTAPNGIKAHEARDDDSVCGFGSFGYVERTPDGPPRIPDGLALSILMNLDGVPQGKSSDPMEDMRKAKKRFLTIVGGAPGDSGVTSVDDVLTMEQLCQLLENGLDRPIADETNLAATYALNVQSDVHTTQDFLGPLCSKLGLVITPGRRNVTVLVVRERED